MSSLVSNGEDVGMKVTDQGVKIGECEMNQAMVMRMNDEGMKLCRATVE